MMDAEGFAVLNRINETTTLCHREHPLYEQVSNYSVALYIMGYFKSSDLMSCEDIDMCEAAALLKEDFMPVEAEQLPHDYHICESRDRYLLVIGDPTFPEHFAVLMDIRSQQPYFSKLKFFGSGFDSLAELEEEFLGKNGLGPEDIHYYKRKPWPPKAACDYSKIYTFRNDGSYAVFQDESLILPKEAKLCR